jgi:hypothetical protein
MGKSKGVFGEWVAYVHQPEGQQPGWGTTDPVNHPLRIVVARGPEGVPKEVAAVPGVAAYDDIVWSPDGRWIAATTFADSSQGAGIKVLVVGVSPDGDVSSPARLIDTPITGSAWSLQGLPDGTAVTLYGQSPPDMDFDIWLIPVRNSGRATSLTRDEGTGITYSLLSPDGRYVASRRRSNEGRRCGWRISGTRCRGSGRDRPRGKGPREVTPVGAGSSREGCPPGSFA